MHKLPIWNQIEVPEPHYFACILSSDKYSSQFGGGSQYAYFHEEDETSFQLVDTAKTQKTAYQRNRMRFAQVRQRKKSTETLNAENLGMYWFVFDDNFFQQRNLRRDKDRRNLTQFNMQTLPKSAKQKERWEPEARVLFKLIIG